MLPINHDIDTADIPLTYSSAPAALSPAVNEVVVGDILQILRLVAAGKD